MIGQVPLPHGGRDPRPRLSRGCRRKVNGSPTCNGRSPPVPGETTSRGPTAGGEGDPTACPGGHEALRVLSLIRIPGLLKLDVEVPSCNEGPQVLRAVKGLDVGRQHRSPVRGGKVYRLHEDILAPPSLSPPVQPGLEHTTRDQDLPVSALPAWRHNNGNPSLWAAGGSWTGRPGKDPAVREEPGPDCRSCLVPVSLLEERYSATHAGVLHHSLLRS